MCLPSDDMQFGRCQLVQLPSSMYSTYSILLPFNNILFFVFLTFVFLFCLVLQSRFHFLFQFPFFLTLYSNYITDWAVLEFLLLSFSRHKCTMPLLGRQGVLIVPTLFLPASLEHLAEDRHQTFILARGSHPFLIIQLLVDLVSSGVCYGDTHNACISKGILTAKQI